MEITPGLWICSVYLKMFLQFVELTSCCVSEWVRCELHLPPLLPEAHPLPQRIHQHQSTAVSFQERQGELLWPVLYFCLTADTQRFLMFSNVFTAADGLWSLLQNSAGPDGGRPQTVRQLYPETQTHRGTTTKCVILYFLCIPINPSCFKYLL